MISVVIPTHDGGGFLEETLASLAAQTRPPGEVLVVDDGSTARATSTVLQGLREGRGPLPVRVLQQARQGPGPARDLGLREARGELVLPLDDDDLLLPGALEALEAGLAAAPGAAFAFCHTELFGLEKGVEVSPRFNPFLQTVANGLTTTALLRRQEVLAAGLSWPAMDGFEDWSFWLALAEKGLDGVCVEAPLFRYRRKRRAGRMAAALARREELAAQVRARHPESYSFAAQAALKARFAPGLEVVLEDGAAPAALAEALAGQQLDDVSSRPAPACALTLLAGTRARFLLFAGPAQLARIKASWPSLLDQAVRTLEGHPEAAALVVPGDEATLDAQARVRRLCPFPAGRAVAPGDLLFARVSACAGLFPEELPATLTPREPWVRALAAGRGLLLAQSFTELFARRTPASGLTPLQPLPLPGPPPRGALYKVWRLGRGAAVKLAGEERVASALQPIKSALAERQRLAARDAAWAEGLVRPRALPPSRRKEAALLEGQPVRHQRLAPLPQGPRARVVIATHLLTTGGVERALIDLCACLDHSKYELIVVTTVPAAHEWECRLAPHVDEVLHFGGLVPQQQIPQAIVDLAAARGCAALLVTNCWEGYEACKLARTALPALATMDYQHTDFQPSGSDFARASATRYRDVLDLRATHTEYVRRRYQVYGLGPVPVRVIRSVCDEEQVFNPEHVAPGALRARLGLGPEVPLVGFIGRMIPEKAPLFVLSVYAAVALRVPEARFVLVGEGPLLEAARAAASLPPLAGKVTFLPANTEVAPFLRDLTLLLMASVREGLPLVFMEALALRTPVVATAVEGIPELLDETVGACIPDLDDPGEKRRRLVEAAVAIMRDPALRERMGRAGRLRIERDFSSAATRAAWQEMFALLVRGAK
jgi:glycosyltransferase involved in cell wall biosynthesis